MNVIMNYEENTLRNNRIIQNALRQIDSEILANAICNQSDDVHKIIYRNMSIRAVNFIKKDIQNKRGRISKKQDEEAQSFFIKLLKNSNDNYIEISESDLSTIKFKFSTDSLDELTNTLLTIAEISKNQGVLILEKELTKINNPLLKKGLELVIDGIDPMIIASILEKYKRTILKKEEIKMNMIMETIDSINYKEYPEVLKEKLEAHNIQKI